jgi:hypothetical protein
MRKSTEENNNEFEKYVKILQCNMLSKISETIILLEHIY